ncbi:MAG TPA: LLM class F420-dependent oxidoreductase, partial [Acidimicrobiales bacterium]|nr:LLM class F420-dependent oxidoreductase [Acidimicrobiales bacterium]
VTAKHYDDRLAWVRKGAGDRFDEVEIQCLTFFVRVVDNRAQVIEETARLMQMDPADAAEVPLALVGSRDEIVEVLLARRERWAMSYFVVHEAEMDDFAPVVAALAGA